MVTIVVEDGNGDTPTANAYDSVSNVTTYATNRGITLTGSVDEEIIKAMDFLESQNFVGFRASRTQPLQWPRYNVIIDEIEVNSNVVPTELKNALAEVVIAIDAGDDPGADIDRETKREKVDVIEIEYMDGAASKKIQPRIGYWLNKLLKPGASGVNFFVGRA